MDFKDLLFGLILFVTFSSLIITPVVLMGVNYGKSTSEISEGALDVELFDQSFENISTATENYRERYSSSSQKAESGATEETGWGLFGIIQDLVSLIITPFTLLATILSQIIKFPESYINVILGLLGLTIILTLWKLWKQGY